MKTSARRCRPCSAIRSHDLQEAIPVIRAIPAEGVVTPAAATALEPLLASLENGDLYDLQERYVPLFDCSRTRRSTCSSISMAKPRPGRAMVDLLKVSTAPWLDLAGPSARPIRRKVAGVSLDGRWPRRAKRPMRVILIALAERLARRESVYAAVSRGWPGFSADPAAEEVQVLLAQQDDNREDLAAPSTRSEEAVTFGSGLERRLPGQLRHLPAWSPALARAAR